MEGPESQVQKYKDMVRRMLEQDPADPSRSLELREASAQILYDLESLAKAPEATKQDLKAYCELVEFVRTLPTFYKGDQVDQVDLAPFERRILALENDSLLIDKDEPQEIRKESDAEAQENSHSDPIQDEVQELAKDIRPETIQKVSDEAMDEIHEELQLVVTVTVDQEDDDTCGQDLELAGRNFDAKIILYHEPAKAWVVKCLDPNVKSGHYFFVNAEFIKRGAGDGDIPKPTREEMRDQKSMECLFQADATETTEEGDVRVGGQWKQGHCLYEFQDENGTWYLMRVPDYEASDFYGGYAIGRISDDDLRFSE